MLSARMQRFVRIFMIATLVLATMPHAHLTSPREIVNAACDLHAASIDNHDANHPDRREPANSSKAGHNHGSVVADHIHDKPFPSEIVAVKPVSAGTSWQQPGDQTRPNLLCRSLDRPPRLTFV
jgi:hypothetical protein